MKCPGGDNQCDVKWFQYVKGWIKPYQNIGTIIMKKLMKINVQVSMSIILIVH